MLQFLDDYSAQPVQQKALCQAFDQALRQLDQPAPPGDRTLVGRLEGLVQQDPNACFACDPQGLFQLQAAGQSLGAGRFGCPSVYQLKQRLESKNPSGTARLSLFVLVGSNQLTDIGALQALAPPQSLFQVASQFNCLESPGPYLASVQDYYFDPTQGPRASISAFPGTLLRHYWAPGPDGSRFTQKHPEPQLNLLHRVALSGVARVLSGYLQPQNIESPSTLASLLHDHFEEIEIGLHEEVQVVFGHNWDGPVPQHTGPHRIAQAFTSTLAAGGYGRVDFGDSQWLDIVRQLQRAAYFGTLLGAAASGQRRAVLTLIGGGVFGNPMPVIWDSILWACQQLQPLLSHPLTVVVNSRTMGDGIELTEVKKQCQKRGGELILCNPRGHEIA